MFTIASILHLGFMSLKTLSPEIHETAPRPVASTLCMGLYQAAVEDCQRCETQTLPAVGSAGRKHFAGMKSSGR